MADLYELVERYVYEGIGGPLRLKREPSDDPRPTLEDCKCRKGARCLACMEQDGLADDCPRPGPIKGTCPDCPYGGTQK